MASAPAPVKQAVATLTYRRLSRQWAIGEFVYQGNAGKRARRRVVIRERLDPTEPASKQLKLLDSPD